MRKNSIFHVVILICLVIFLNACNFRPEALAGLFATATSTSTPYPTATSTPRATNTPIAPLLLNSCAFASYCPDSFSIFSFLGETRSDQVNYYVEIPYNLPVIFHVGWTAKDQTFLDENIRHLHYFFEIDGNDYYESRFTAQDLVYFEDEPDIGYPSISTGIEVTGWEIGETHWVKIGFEFDDEIYDGWDTFPAGTRYVYAFQVVPVKEPTPTPVPTATPTEKPTITPTYRPTAVPSTATPACNRNGSIRIQNDTGGQVTIYLKGPASFTFYVSAGSQVLSVCPGTYSYTAYGCGGASRTGSASDGDEIEFWCE